MGSLRGFRASVAKRTLPAPSDPIADLQNDLGTARGDIASDIKRQDAPMCDRSRHFGFSCYDC